jgi:hypothetical protein
MRWRRTARRPAAEPRTYAADRLLELPETMPDEFEWDLSWSERVIAARGLVMLDEKQGRVTPQWVLDLAEDDDRP